jgi:hypothetical protein
MASLRNTLENTETAQLLRAYYSTKAYLIFDISVFNAGISIFIKCTDIFKFMNNNTWNGNDFIIENDNTIKYYIVMTLKQRINIDLGYKITPNQLKRIKKILKS